jgi:CRP/FNR family transcriptional regulator, cyclic AMP receptor protein
MQGPYGFEANESWRKVKENAFFSHLTPGALKDFDAMQSSSVYPAGAVLFIEQQAARGIFVLCEGQVKLTISSSEGKTLIVRIAEAGEILGLTPVLSGTAYEVTAETLHPCQVAFVRRDDFSRFLAQHPEAYHGIVPQLNAIYQRACEHLHTVGLSSSAQARLAKALLDWSAGVDNTKSGTRIALPLTQEEIGEFIGTSRETVTRTFTEFRNQHLVTMKGSTVTIPNRAALQHVASAA